MLHTPGCVVFHNIMIESNRIEDTSNQDELPNVYQSSVPCLKKMKIQSSKGGSSNKESKEGFFKDLECFRRGDQALLCLIDGVSCRWNMVAGVQIEAAKEAKGSFTAFYLEPRLWTCLDEP